MYKFITVLTLTLSCLFFCGAKHIGPRYDAENRESLDVFGETLAKKNQMRFMNSGVGTLVDSPDGTWALNFISHNQVTIDEARLMAAAMVYDTLYEMYHNPLYKTYCDVAKRETRGRDSGTLFDERIGFKVAFWDADVNRPLHPYLALIKFTDGKIYFYYADPKTQALQAPIIETIDSLGVKPSYK